jgi:hypothetical protein
MNALGLFLEDQARTYNDNHTFGFPVRRKMIGLPTRIQEFDAS